MFIRDIPSLLLDWHDTQSILDIQNYLDYLYNKYLPGCSLIFFPYIFRTLPVTNLQSFDHRVKSRVPTLTQWEMPRGQYRN